MADTERSVLDIRKYSNRRLYDATRSQHITAEDLHRLVREGYDVVVTDSATGADITHQVLAQLILEREAPKLEVFPVTLLHEIIRANQQMWKRFVEQWLTGLTSAISQQADVYAKRVADFGRRSLDGSVLGKLLAVTRDRSSSERTIASADADESLRESVRRLEAQVERLSAERKLRRSRRT
jgi:polyhydroxyalkanoate synthesis repressor PhaR